MTAGTEEYSVGYVESTKDSLRLPDYIIASAGLLACAGAKTFSLTKSLEKKRWGFLVHALPYLTDSHMTGSSDLAIPYKVDPAVLIAR